MIMMEHTIITVGLAYGYPETTTFPFMILIATNERQRQSA